MDGRTAEMLHTKGATFVFLGVPKGTVFGIDLKCWRTDEEFRGIRLIPPGMHYIYYASASETEIDDVSQRSGFFQYFNENDIIVKMWDKKTEDVSKEVVDEHTVERIRENLNNIDRYLAPYPYDIWSRWHCLTRQISEALAKKLSPEQGIIRSEEFHSIPDSERPRGIKKSKECSEEEKQKTMENKEEPSQGSSEHFNKGESSSSPRHSGTRRLSRMTEKEREDAMLPNLKPVEGTVMRFTEIPKNKYPPGSSPMEITKHHLDQSYTLELMIAQHDEPLHIIGELQFAYTIFLIGHYWNGFDHWRNLVVLLCSCEDALDKYRDVFIHFIATIQHQMKELPLEFLCGIEMEQNVFYKKFREFFRNVYSAKSNQKLVIMIEKFKKSLADLFQWEFPNDDTDDEDEKPVVVEMEEINE
ncbi:protein AAR2 homolog [Papilio machaon]|uniref:protein AAR2 homolog n=1 Tax=Papilio machaon TaxID=76193 RepID=UPI001E66376E|nr:protein AAR2 homolog [Papilio machaon]